MELNMLFILYKYYRKFIPFALIDFKGHFP